MERPIVGISMGDPFGNGPEITVKALNDPEVYKTCRPLVVGDRSCMEYALAVSRKVNGIDLKLNLVESPAQGRYEYGTIDLIDLSKEAINMAGHHYSGHTEIYAEYTGTKKYAMMLAHHDFRVVHVSTHVSLREACDRVKKARVLEVIEIADQVCRDMGIEHPKVAVAGLNPHCGENGLFGREEIEEIKPAIDAAKAEGIDAIGPCPPDSVFSQAIGGWYDIVVVMYHDQGHIPIKTVGFVYDREKQSWKAVEGVNITLGLPIVRVSVDHGTGYALAGTGTSNELSLVNSIAYAASFGKNRT